MKKTITLFIAALIITATTMAQTVPNYVPNNGLVGWWPFNGNAIDESINTNDGTVNGATLTTDRFGNVNSAYSFNGTNNKIVVNDATPLRLNNTDFTISFWTYINAYSTGGGTAFIYKRGVGVQNGWALGADQGTQNKLFLGLSGGADPRGYSNSTLGLNGWHHVTIVYTLTIHTLECYIDGLLDNTTTGVDGNNLPVAGGLPTPNASCTSSMYFGQDTGNNNYWLNGKLDDIGIWNRAFLSCEIKDLYFGSLGNCCNNAVTNQPTNQTLSSGSTAIFTVSATAGSTLQWQTNLGVGFQNLSNAGQYSGVTTQTLTVSSIGVNNNNQTFRCIVGSGSCSDTSNVATLSLSTVGFEDVSLLKNVELYPNPAITVINVKMSTALINNAIIELYDATGKLIMQQKVTNEFTSLNINGLSNGIYSVRVITDNEQTIKRIVKQQ